MQIRHGAYLLLGIPIVLSLLLAYPRSRAMVRTFVSQASLAPGIAEPAEEATISLKPSSADVKTWRLHNYAFPSNKTYWPCGGHFTGTGAGPGGPEIIGPLEVVAGYDHYFDGGTPPLPCQERINNIYRGSVWFDLSEIRSKLPGVFVKNALLHFRPIENGIRDSNGDPFIGNKFCGDELLVASVDWRKGFTGDLPPGAPFKSLSVEPGKSEVICGLGGCSIEVGPVVNNWVTGKEDDFGFIIKGEDEAPTTEDNARCWTRYGDFQLTVTYKYDTKLIFPLETPKPTPPFSVKEPRGDLGDKTSLKSLIGLLREAESIGKVEIVQSELKEIREAANRASKIDPGNPAAMTEMIHVRTMLRRIVDDPHGESAEFQEKIANALKLAEDYSTIGDGNGLKVRTDTAFGLITTTFDTLNGTVSVNLPDDVAPGDTISGTVISEPRGSTKDEQAKNEDSLNGYVVEVAKQETPTEQQPKGSKWVIPPATQFIPVVLKTRQGKEIARTEVPVMQGNTIKAKTGQTPNDSPSQGNYSTPQFGQAGRPVTVAGPFDGDFNNTAVKLANNTAQFLAESPRKVVVRSPANTIGRTTIEVNEQNRVVARCSYQSVGIKLAADKLNLIRGEHTRLTATLSGLDGLTSPVSMQLTNATPWTVRMEGGETQTITAQPGEFVRGSFFATRTLTGVSAGGFSINATVNPAAFPQGILKSCDGGTRASESILDLDRGVRTSTSRGLAGTAQSTIQVQPFGDRNADSFTLLLKLFGWKDDVGQWQIQSNESRWRKASPSVSVATKEIL